MRSELQRQVIIAIGIVVGARVEPEPVSGQDSTWRQGHFGGGGCSTVGRVRRRVVAVVYGSFQSHMATALSEEMVEKSVSFLCVWWNRLL